MKIIFLDIDGVLVSDSHACSTFLARVHDAERLGISVKDSDTRLTKTRDGYGLLFDPTCVLNLRTIIKATDAVIVISSSWRADGIERLRNLWNWRCMPGTILCITPNLDSRIRGEEIKAWLDDHKELNLESYVILDDDSDMLDSQLNNFVKINSELGITHKDVESAIKILNSHG